ncbi:MAG: PLP-dependent aminotransferase family protein [Synergistaceae bacterium]|nr:PLP-dependent aminotransferase family protein [Synergistaceae bacterium]
MSGIWQENFSSIAKNNRPSPIREMLALIKKPEMISFAGGMPAPEIFPVDKFYEGAHILKDDGQNLLQYGTTEGYPPLKEFLASWTAPRMGRKVSGQEMLITTGSQQALDLFAWSLLDEGDYVITEDPTYLAALTVFFNHGGKFLSIPMDRDGMQVELLPDIIRKARSEGKKVKFIYTIVNFQNPAGSTMSLERRKRLVEISKEFGIPIFEDDPYGYVRFDGEHLPSIFSFHDEGGVVYAGSFSKILSPGTRVGWITGPKEIIRNLTVFKQATDLCSSTITQALVAEYCMKGHLEAHLPVIIDNYRIKRDAMEKSFEKHLAPLGVTWVKPDGGFFYWLNFPGVDTNKLFERSVEKNVAFVPGGPFCPSQGTGIHNARLCYTFPSPETIEEGVRRLAEAVNELGIPAVH